MISDGLVEGVNELDHYLNDQIFDDTCEGDRRYRIIRLRNEGEYLRGLLDVPPGVQLPPEAVLLERIEAQRTRRLKTAATCWHPKPKRSDGPRPNTRKTRQGAANAALPLARSGRRISRSGRTAWSSGTDAVRRAPFTSAFEQPKPRQGPQDAGLRRECSQIPIRLQHADYRNRAQASASPRRANRWPKRTTTRERCWYETEAKSRSGSDRNNRGSCAKGLCEREAAARPRVPLRNQHPFAQAGRNQRSALCSDQFGPLYQYADEMQG